MSATPSFHQQLTDAVLMVRPVDFAFNEQTAGDNEFQQRMDDKTPDEIRQRALKEFEQSVKNLEGAGVQVLVLEPNSNVTTKCPDAVFPNNWFASDASGTVYTFPMFTENRRAEAKRLPDVLELLKNNNFEVERVCKMDEIPSEKALEGTGCMIFDHINGIVFAALSERCNEMQLHEYLQYTNGLKKRAVTFRTKSSNGKEFYHTNVMMSIGEEFVVVCADAIVPEDRERILDCLREIRKDVIILTLEQTEKLMCANIIQLATKDGGKVIVMSDTAAKGFTEEQMKVLEKHGKIVTFPISGTIEPIGGGSARCMIAEVFLKRKEGSTNLSSLSTRSTSALGLKSSLSLNTIETNSLNLHVEDSELGLGESRENVTVVIRVRPPRPKEIQRAQEYGENFMSTVRIDSSKSITIFDTNDGNYGVPQTFTFDGVYGFDSNQKDIYENTARNTVLSVLKGYNATLFAYGQTGTGKTHTMEGFNAGEGRGIIPRATEDIFNYIETNSSSNVNFLIRASYLEIYKEVISDLLDPSRTRLKIKEDKEKGVHVENLSETVVRTPKEIYELIERGSRERKKAPTSHNDKSSRSHSVFIIVAEHLERCETSGDDNIECENADALTGKEGKRVYKESCCIGKLNLVDLAGSERATSSSGERLEETKKINLSLVCLGDVIRALTVGNPHVPYRNSRLTRLLADSLGGNCKTTMFAMISPAPECFNESLSTLKFAKRSKSIKNTVKVNEDVDQVALLRRYEVELKKLREELTKKNKSVVDKQRILDLEEQRRKAEEDKLAAFEALELKSREFLHEKTEKRKLEEKIAYLQSQLLVGGEKIEETPVFRKLIKQEYERVHKQYEKKMAELEKERQTIEEDKAQVDRYKQLLLKQRDIMIALTARLNERDETILSLQEELDAYDHHQKMLEDALDRKTATIIHYQRKTDVEISTKEKEMQALKKIIEMKMLPYMNAIYKNLSALESPENEDAVKQIKKQTGYVTQLMQRTTNALCNNTSQNTSVSSETSSNHED
ncbi:hypothetical protein ABK040_003682 [Willaertia magna]